MCQNYVSTVQVNLKFGFYLLGLNWYPSELGNWDIGLGLDNCALRKQHLKITDGVSDNPGSGI